MKNLKLSSAIALALSISVSATATAMDHKDTVKAKHDEAATHSKEMDSRKSYKSADLSNYDEGDAIVLSGKILKTDKDELTLGYGDRKIEVEFEEWLWEDVDMSSVFTEGERVTVSGTVDKDFFSSDEIEANNIYLNDQYVYYYLVDTSPAYYIDTSRINSDRQGTSSEKMNEQSMADLEDGAFFSASGQIAKIDGREFTLKTGNQKINVDTSDLTNNPFDNVGLQNLRVGDRVYVYGEIDDKFYDEKELSANSIITLKDARDMKGKSDLATN